MRAVVAVLLLSLAGCAGAPLGDDDTDGVALPDDDLDRDGHKAPEDCDDTDPAVGPGAPEQPADGVDQDCDGQEACWADTDRDGHGGTAVAPGPLDCLADGLAPTSDDCDDSLAAVHPGAPETCDRRDDDCNGLVDDVAEPPIWWLDRDDDGFGDASATYRGCLRAPGYRAAGGPSDCGDLDPTTFPGAPETAGDGIDQDCDGVDHCFGDADRDGFGQGEARPGEALTCEGADSPNADDCDDTTAFVRPGAQERCGTEDRDCDGVPGDLDEDAVDPVTWYRDNDGDGHGNPNAEVRACLLPAKASASGDDCDDTRATTAPDQPELCNGRDDDCDERVDDDDDDLQDGATWFRDRDQDGFGDPLTGRLACAPLGEWTATNGADCDDRLAVRRPDGVEVAGNSLDEDCDGLLACFVDGDADGVAGSTTALIAGETCEVEGYGTSSLDCRDDDPTTQRFTFWADKDGDGWGATAEAIALCTRPLKYTDRPGDCNDLRADVHPEAPETPADQTDGNCDGLELCLVDADGDGWGGLLTAETSSLACTPAGLTRLPGDCDDGDPTVSPGAQEAIADGVDSTCDGFELCFEDRDVDGWGGRTLFSVRGTSCDVPGASARFGDCDDGVDTVYPGAPERCAPGDENCNSLEGDDDPDLADAPLWWPDRDGDGRGDPSFPRAACARPDAHVADATDCDDASAAWGRTCPWDELALGQDLLCGRRTDGEVVCSGTEAPAPSATRLSAEGAVVCALTPEGRLACSGPLGDPRTQPPGGTAWTDVAVGSNTACALDEQGTPTCWGPLSPPEGLSGLAALSVGDLAACGLGAEGVATCWGPDAAGLAAPTPLATLSLGDDLGCGLDLAGALICWGSPSTPPAPAESLLRFDALAVDGRAACALTVSGDPTCWGTAPQAPAPSQPLRALTVGPAAACALDPTALVTCWGAGLPPALPGPDVTVDTPAAASGSGG